MFFMFFICKLMFLTSMVCTAAAEPQQNKLHDQQQVCHWWMLQIWRMEKARWHSAEIKSVKTALNSCMK